MLLEIIDMENRITQFKRELEIEDVEHILCSFLYLPIVARRFRNDEWFHEHDLCRLTALNPFRFNRALNRASEEHFIQCKWTLGMIRSRFWKLTERGKAAVL